MTTKQKALPSPSMLVYKTIVSNFTVDNNWKLRIYCLDEHGRKWCSSIKIEDPRLLGGESIFSSEIMEIEE